MNILRSTTLGVVCALTVVMSPAKGDSDYECGWMPHHRGYGAHMGWGGPWMPPGGPMMGPGYGRMMGVDPDILSDEYLDRIGERISEHYQAMQRIASEQDKTARRDLVREQMKSMQALRWNDDDDETQHRGYRHGWMMGRDMMGPGMMGPGMMGPGMMGPGMMGPGMMGYRGGDEYLDRIAERMVETYARIQQLAATTDQAKRRELVREHLRAMQRF